MIDDLALAVSAAAEAGALAFSMLGSASWDKSPGHPVSEADIAVDRLLQARLLAARPDYGWLSEETADNPARLQNRALWVVDPIDGTRDFLRGRKGWAVSVALVVDGEVRIGVLDAPALGDRFAAARGHGATRNGEAIRVSGRTEAAGARLPVDPQMITSKLWTRPLDAVAVYKPNGIALRIAMVACGEADAVFDGRSSSEWDVAAAALILEEAGGAITDRNGAQYRFNKASPTTAGLVAATPALHAPMLQRLAEARAALDRAGIRPNR
jgi:myo-inositol-1(or 4)-monophosphatase